MQKTPPKLDEKTSPKLSWLRKIEACNLRNNSTPLKETKPTESKFKTPEKISHQNEENQSVENEINKEKTPMKSPQKLYLKSELTPSYEIEDGMLSTAEQARLLIAANKTPSKSVNKTPVKQSATNGKRSLENSPATPGKYKRVELTTLASPKAKKIKQI